MHSSFSDFSSSLLLNYWNENRHPLIDAFIKVNAPFLAQENIGYTAYSGVEPSEEDIERVIQTTTFKEHPYFKSNYEKVSFSILLKMLNDKCIGHYSAQVIFHHTDSESLAKTFNDLKNTYLSFIDTEVEQLSHDIIEIVQKNSMEWPTSIFIRTSKKTDTEQLLVFSASEVFF